MWEKSDKLHRLMNTAFFYVEQLTCRLTLFFVVYTLLHHKIDVIKYSQNLSGISSLRKFEHFMAWFLWAIKLKCRPGKIESICFLQ